MLAFDLMGTLLADPFRVAHEVATGRSVADLLALGLAGHYHDLELGRIAEPEYWRLLADAGVQADVGRFHAVRRSGYAWLPGMRDLFAHWSERCPTVVASNCPPWIEPERARLFEGLRAGWYPSYRCGERKPSPAYFEGLCARVGTTARHLVLVDDKPVNTAAVRALGGRAVTFLTAAAAATDLADLLAPTG